MFFASRESALFPLLRHQFVLRTAPFGPSFDLGRSSFVHPRCTFSVAFSLLFPKLFLPVSDILIFFLFPSLLIASRPFFVVLLIYSVLSKGLVRSQFVFLRIFLIFAFLLLATVSRCFPGFLPVFFFLIREEVVLFAPGCQRPLVACFQIQARVSW